jgi:5-methylcytosine-specific restriction enzyme subunit McrC
MTQPATPPTSAPVLQLTEARTSAPLTLSTIERQALETSFEATISTGPDDTYRVQPGSVVGSLQIASRTIVVQPKIRIDRVLFMTAYAADPHHWHNHWSTIAHAGSLTDGVTALFVSAYQRVLAQGLLRSYRTVDRNTTAIRGRIRWPQQARQITPLPIAVRYQVHDDDIPENQILRATAQILRRQPLSSPVLRAGLARIWQQLRDLTPIPASPQLIDRITWTRHNAHYRPLLQLARTILAGTMPDLHAGAVPVTGFTLRLYDVFEQFVRTALRTAFGATHEQFPDQPRAHNLFLDTDHRIRLNPDLGLRIDGQWRFVGDVKYKRDSNTGGGFNADLYQLLAYATAADLPDATLIYADGPAATPSHQIRHTTTNLHVHHLDLDQPPTAVLRDLNRLARDSLCVP